MVAVLVLVSESVRKLSIYVVGATSKSTSIESCASYNALSDTYAVTVAVVDREEVYEN